MESGNELHDDSRAVVVAEASTIALLNASEIDMQIATAKKWPRSIKRFRDEALQMVTLNDTVAAECFYSLPRDGKTVEGPSARFGEVIASAWGNCRAGARVVSDQGDFVTAQGAFHDLERNVAITYEVQRRITNKHGKRYSADMIGVTGNAASSIALRNAILKGVPKAFWQDLYNAARQCAMGDFKTLANRRAEALKAFVSFGVTSEQVFAKLHVTGVEDITLEGLLVLRGLLTALRDGDTTPEQAFAPEAGEAPPPAGPKRKEPDAPPPSATNPLGLAEVERQRSWGGPEMISADSDEQGGDPLPMPNKAAAQALLDDTGELATPGEKMLLLRKLKGLPARDVLDACGLQKINETTLEGITKAQWQMVKAKV